ncbi:MAG: trimethylamine methyltransferase family protein [Anaerolineae bacterium]
MTAFHFLTDHARRAIAAGALELLESVGVQVAEPEAVARLQGAGARVDGGRVRLPAFLVEQALGTAPRELALYTRDGHPAISLGGHRASFGAHTDAPDVLDPDTGARRACLEADVARHARLVDALPNIDYATASGMVADRPAAVGDRVALANCLEHSPKPVLAMPVTLDGLADCHEMAALAAGGEEALRERPLVVIYAEPVSPLVHPEESVRKLTYCARHHIPVVYSGFAAAGGTAPQSLAAAVVQLCAESLSGLVIHQLVEPGAPFIFGGMPSVMDMKTTLFSYGAPEFQRGVTLMAEMAHYFRLPNFGTAGTGDAQVFDGQAVLETTSSCLLAVLSGAGLVHDVGLLGSATLVVPEMIVAAEEIVAMVRHLAGEVPCAPEDLALDVLAEVGPGGEFVTHPHTLDHFRAVWYPDLLYRGGARRWTEGDPQAFEQRVNARTRALLDAHRPALLAPEIAAQIQRIVRRAEEADRE